MPLLDSWLFAWVDGGPMAANMRAACINTDSSLTVFTLTMWCQASTFLELAACLFYVSFSKKQLGFVPPIFFFPLFSILEMFLSWLEKCVTNFKQGFPHSSVGKNPPANAGDSSSIPELGRSPGGRKGYTRLYSGMENSMDCTVHGVAKRQAWLSDLQIHFHGRER